MNDAAVPRAAMAAHEQGDSALAERLIREAIQKNPNDAAALSGLGLLLARQARLDEASLALRQARDIQPDAPGHHFNLATVLLQAGQVGPAAQEFEAGLRLDPAFEPGYIQGAAAWQQAGRVDRAIELLLQLKSKNPANANARSMLASMHLATGRWTDAIDEARQSLELQPSNGHAMKMLGLSYRAVDALVLAEQWLTRAIERRPKDIELLMACAEVLRDLGRHQEAADRAEQALMLADGRFELLRWSSGLLLRAGREQLLISRLEHVAAQDAEHAEPHFALGAVLEAVNRVDEARSCLLRALACDAEHAGAMRLLARIEVREGKLHDAHARLKSLLALDLPADDRGSAMLLLGEVMDKLGRTEEAWTAIVDGKRILAEIHDIGRFQLDDHLREIETMRHAFAETDPGSWPNAVASDDRPADPVFLVGFPRSGTTLTEQMLGAHPVIQALDEVSALSEVRRAVTQCSGGEIISASSFQQLTDDQVLSLRETYWSAVDTYLGHRLDASMVFLDKMPLNLLNLPLIRCVFPQARVLVALRHPCDCVLSCLMQDFRPNRAMAHFYSLERAAMFYAAVMRCWLDWQNHFGLRFLEFRYEETVRDTRDAVQRLLEFLELPWSDDVLGYRERSAGRYVSTPSRRAVLEPVHSRARGRWRRYAAQLQSVDPILQPLISALGYADEAAT